MTIATSAALSSRSSWPSRPPSEWGADPHTSALSDRESSTGTDSRRTVGGPSYGIPNSEALSANSPNSS
jgi:hypothetical protein